MINNAVLRSFQLFSGFTTSMAVRLGSARARSICGLLVAVLCLSAGAFAQSAYYSGVVNTVGSGSDSPIGVAVDTSGDVFVGDYGNNAVYEIVAGTGGAASGQVNSSSTVNTVGSGFDNPYGVAVDASGDVFVADLNSSTVKEIVAGTGGAAAGQVNSSSTVNTVGSGFSNPYDVAVDASGNVFVADTNNNAVKEIVAGTGGAAAGQVNSSSTVNTVGSGFSSPYGVAVDTSGDVFVADHNGAVYEIVAGTGGAAAGQVNSSSTVNTIGSSFSNSLGVAVDAGGNVFVGVNEIEAGTGGAAAGQVNSSSTVITVGSGFSNPVGVAVDGHGDLFVANYQSAAVSEIEAGAASFGTVSVGSSSSTILIPFTFTTGGTLSGWNVFTQGVTGKDFTEVPGSDTCNTSTTYSAGDSCSIAVKFSPAYPGVRTGAVQLMAGSTVVATAALNGIGSGPQAIFADTTTSASAYAPSAQVNLGSGFSIPIEVAVDPSGNVFVSDGGNNKVKEILAAGGYATVNTLAVTNGNFNFPGGVAVDGSGNIFVADYGNSKVKEILASGGYTTVNTVGSGFDGPQAVELDGSGNVFVCDTNHNAVKEILAGTGGAAAGTVNASSTVITLGSGFSGPQGVAVDASGNIFVGDTNNSLVKEIVAAGGYSTIKTLGGGFNNPANVTVDASGNVFVADYGTGYQKEIPASCIAGANNASCVLTLGSGFSGANGVVVDGSGNVFVADANNNTVTKLDYADPPSLSFASTSLGSTSSDSPQTVTVSNDGNSALTFTALGYPIDFPQNTSGTNLCTSTTSLTEGGLCNLSINFTPTQAGSPLSEDATLTNNTLNASPGVTQSIPVSGTATAATTITAANAAVRASASAQTVTLSATVTSSGGIVNSGTVTFTVVNGSSVVVGTATTSGTVSYGSASVSYSLPGGTAAGAYTIEATYNASADFTTSSDNSHTLTVESIVQTLTPTVTLSAVPSYLNSGTATTFTATFTTTVSAPSPTQSMYFYAGSDLLGEAALSSSGSTTYTATLTTADLPQGTQTITATYPGDSNYTTASSSGQSVYVIANILWIGDSTGATSALSAIGTPYLTPAQSKGGNGMAIDSSGNVWSLNPGSNSVAEFSSTGSVVNSGYTGGGLSTPTSVAIDGSGNVWITNSNGSISEFNSSGTPVSTTAYTGGSGGEFSTPSSIAIDISGNLWIANSGSNTVTEVLGAAAPTVPLATGVANNTTATKP